MDVSGKAMFQENLFFPLVGALFVLLFALATGGVLCFFRQRSSAARKASPSGQAFSTPAPDSDLQHAADCFRSLCQNSALGVVLVDTEGNFTYANERYLAIIGATAAEVHSGRWIEHLHPDDQENIRLRWDEALRSERGFSAERRSLFRDGRILWANVHASPIHNAQGRFRGFVTTVEDITARKEAEAALRSSEQRFSRVFQLLPDLIIISEADSGVLVDMNQQWTPVSGWARAEAIGKTSLELGFWAHPEDRDEVIRLLSGDVEVRQREYWLRRKNGELFQTEYSGRFFESAQRRYLISIISDISAQRRIELERRHALAAQEQSEKKFRVIFDQAFQLIGTIDLEGRLIEANLTALRFCDCKAEEVLGKPFCEAPWWQHDAAQKQWLRDAIGRALDGELVRAETTHPDADGQLRTIDFSLKPVRDEAGKVTALIAEGRDISDLKAAEEALRISEAKFSGAFQASLDYITISQLDSGQILEVNEAFVRMTGWTRDEAVGKTSTELGIWRYPEERARVVGMLRSSSAVREHPCQIGLKSGETRDCLLNASIIVVGAQRYLLGVVRDVTEKKRAEEALRESQQKFSSIFHLSPQALAVSSLAQGRYVDVNEAWEKTFGLTRVEAIDHTTGESDLWVTPADRRHFIEQLDKHRSLENHECVLLTRSRKPLECLVSGSLFMLNGEQCVVWSIIDVTLQHESQHRIEQLNETLESRVQERTAALAASNRELADALDSLKCAQGELVRSEKLAALGSLVAGIAHELNTPIGNGVTVASTLLERSREFAEDVSAGSLKRSTLNAFVDTARDASALLLRNLDQAHQLVTSFKQVAVDQTSDQRRVFDLRTVLEEVIATLAPMTRKTPYRIELDLAPQITLDSYPGPLGQIITNLMTNALNHAFEQRPQGTIRLSTRALPDKQVEIVFSDDGNGIPEEHRSRIFDPFFTTKLGKGGSGLGLNIVHNIASAVLGGRINLHSHVGAGTSFALTIPLDAPRGKPENAA